MFSLEKISYILLITISIIAYQINASETFSSMSDNLSFIFLIVVLALYGLFSKTKKYISIISLSIAMIFIVIELITHRMTSFYFHKIPTEIISIILDTNIDEVKSNVFFSKNEWLLLFLILANIFSLIFPIKVRINKTELFFSLVVIIPIIFLVNTPMHQTFETIMKNKEIAKQSMNAISQKKDFKWGSTSEYKGKQTVIIFLGETNRGDFLHINGYPKNTTPNLEKEGVISYTDTISQGAYTLSSTPMILTRKGVKDKGIFPERSIITAYKEAGFKTWYVSYLSASHIGDNEINLIAHEADSYIRSSVKDSTLKDILNDKSEKKLIVYKTIGSHYLYHTRYPSEYNIFTPAFTNNDYHTPTIKDKERLENSYANSMAYSVDKQVSDFIKILKNESGIAYLSFISDHGTAIYDDGKSLYGGNTKGNFSIAHFYWFNDKFIAENKVMIKKLELNKNKKITSQCFLDTSLDLSLIKTEKRKGCSLIDPTLKEEERFILNGRVYDFDKEILHSSN